MKSILLAATMLAAAPLAAQAPGSAPAAGAASATPAKPAEKMVCRTSVDTGSLVKRTRFCASAADWARRSDGEQSSARNLVRTNGDGVLSN